MMSSPIYMVEQNIHGAWVIYGALGIRQYYWYTKSEAMRRYREEYKNTHFENER